MPPRDFASGPNPCGVNNGMLSCFTTCSKSVVDHLATCSVQSMKKSSFSSVSGLSIESTVAN